MDLADDLRLPVNGKKEAGLGQGSNIRLSFLQSGLLCPPVYAVASELCTLLELKIAVNYMCPNFILFFFENNNHLLITIHKVIYKEQSLNKD